MSTVESPSLRLVLTSTVSKLGLNSAPIPDEINELVELVILLIRDDLICSESSALAFNEKPSDIVRAALKIVWVSFELDILIFFLIFRLINE